MERRITPKTAGIIMVHMSGAPGDVEAVQALAQPAGLLLLEDCAQCAGGTVGGRRVGTFGDMAIFSFQMNKNMTSGEGGCVVTKRCGSTAAPSPATTWATRATRPGG